MASSGTVTETDGIGMLWSVHSYLLPVICFQKVLLKNQSCCLGCFNRYK